MKIYPNQIFSTQSAPCIGSLPVLVAPYCGNWAVFEDAIVKRLFANTVNASGETTHYQWSYAKPSSWTTTLLGLGISFEVENCGTGTEPVIIVPDSVTNIDIPIRYAIATLCAGYTHTDYVFRVNDRTLVTLTKVNNADILCLDAEVGFPFTYKNGNVYSPPTVSMSVTKAGVAGGSTVLPIGYHLYLENPSFVPTKSLMIASGAVTTPYNLVQVIGNFNKFTVDYLIESADSGFFKLYLDAAQSTVGSCGGGCNNSRTLLNYAWFKYGDRLEVLSSLFWKETLGTQLGGFMFDTVRWVTSSADSYAHIGWNNYDTTNYIHCNGVQVTLPNNVEVSVPNYNTAGYIASTANLENYQKPGTYFFSRVLSTSACGVLKATKQLSYNPQVHTLNVDWIASAGNQQGYNLFVSLLDTTSVLNTLAGNSTTKSNLLASINTYKGLFPTITNWTVYAGFMIYLVNPDGVRARSNTWTITPAIDAAASNFTIVNSNYSFVSGWQTGVPVKYTNALSLNTCLILPNERAFVIPIPKTATANWGTPTTAPNAQYGAIPLKIDLDDSVGYFSNVGNFIWPSGAGTAGTNALLIVKNKNHTL
jgi:hypothetical protein